MRVQAGTICLPDSIMLARTRYLVSGLCLLYALASSASLESVGYLDIKGEEMGQYGQHNINDNIATIIRMGARNNGVPEWLAMAIVGAESGWNSSACGDYTDGPVYILNGVTYQIPYCEIAGRYARSWGLYQLNLAGGQGVGYGKAELINPFINVAIGTPPIRYGFDVAKEAGASGRHFMYLVCINSGHPGWVPESDARIDFYWNRALTLLFNSDGSWARWPDIPTAPAPTPEETETQRTLIAIRDDLYDMQARTGRSLQRVRSILLADYGMQTYDSLRNIKEDLANMQ